MWHFEMWLYWKKDEVKLNYTIFWGDFFVCSLIIWDGYRKEISAIWSLIKVEINQGRPIFIQPRNHIFCWIKYFKCIQQLSILVVICILDIFSNTIPIKLLLPLLDTLWREEELGLSYCHYTDIKHWKERFFFFIINK